MPRAHLLALALLVACAHPAQLPPWSARLIIKCCQLVDTGDHLMCQPLTDDLRVQIDDQDAGTCLQWPRAGQILASGNHKIGVHPVAPLGEDGDCCQEEEVTVDLAAGETHTEDFRLNILRYPD
jgi:hypothetical protein